MKFLLDKEKSIEAALYILNHLRGCDMHKLSKILYFADQKHLSEFGRPITGETYIAMTNGPVPSFLYDVLKSVRGDIDYIKTDIDLNAAFEVFEKYYVGAKRPAEVDLLSGTDTELLDQSIIENRDLDFNTLTEKSHDNAWQKAVTNYEIDSFEIATAGGADAEMPKYIRENMSHQYSFK